MEGPRLEIDRFKLDEEWVNQPKLYREWATKHADTILEVDEAKANLDAVKSIVDAHIRADPEAYGIKKITENVVASIVLGDEDYHKALKQLREAKHKANIIEAVVTALEHRKRALEKLVDLHARDYFAEPRASKSSRDAVDDMERRTARNKVRKSLKRTKARRVDD